jgi:hypothetical protein
MTKSIFITRRTERFFMEPKLPPLFLYSATSMLLGLALSLFVSTSATAQNSAQTPAAPTPAAQAPTTLVPARSFLTMGLHPATFPSVKGIRCSTQDTCAYGLWKMFVVGSDLSALVGTPLFGPLQTPGKWIYMDAFLGAQIMGRQAGKSAANVALGYRSFNFEDSEERKGESEGYFARAEFATELGGDYTQGVSVQGYLAKQKFTGQTQIYREGRENDRIRSALNKFYSFSHKYPAFYISLPGDFEIYTVSPQALDLTYPLFVGLHVEPFLALNQFEIADWITWKEKNFGVKLGLATGYEAFKTGDAKRLAFRVGAGGAFSTHEGSGSSRGRIVEVELKPTPRKRLEYYLDLGLVYHAI